MMSVGTSCVNDMFFLHERGEKTGVYSVFVTNGAHVAALSKFLVFLMMDIRYFAIRMSRGDTEAYLKMSCQWNILKLYSRRFSRPIRRLAMGLQPRRNQHKRLFHPRPLSLP